MLDKYHLFKNKHTFVLLLSMLAAILMLSGCGAQAAPKLYRVGILVGFSPFSPIVEGFKAEMTKLGYIEGENISYDIQTVTVDPAKEKQILKQFVADQVDLIFAFPTGSALAAKTATQGTNIPVLFAMAGLEGNDLVKSVRQPGGNITGIRFVGPDSTVKRFEFLMQIAPQTKRVYVSYNENYQASLASLEALRPAASAMGISLVEDPVTSVKDIETNLQAYAAVDDLGMDAILLLPDDLTQSPEGWALINGFATEHNIPIGGAATFTADTGALFSYVANFAEVGKQSAPLADKILEGTPAGTIPVGTPVEYLRINYKRAQELGLTVPEGLLSQAAEIIR